MIGFVGPDGSNQLPILEHRDPVSDLEDLVQAVGNIQDDGAFFSWGMRANNRFSSSCESTAEGSSRINTLRGTAAFGDLHHLLVRDAELLNRLVDINSGKSDVVQDLIRFSEGRRPIDHAFDPGGWHLTQQDVLSDRQMRIKLNSW